MPWVSVATVALPQGEVSPYKFLFFAVPLSGASFAVGLEAAGAVLTGRLRVGFYYPVFSAAGKILYGPGEEMAGAAVPGATPLHILSYGFASDSLRTAATDEVYGVAIAPDRGVVGATARIWRFT